MSPCIWTTLPDGTRVHIKMARQRRKMCRFCATADGLYLCDFPVGDGTCDAPMCRKCATNVGPDTDYCPNHRGRAPTMQGSLFGGKP
jgi:hypothetical protein